MLRVSSQFPAAGGENPFAHGDFLANVTSLGRNRSGSMKTVPVLLLGAGDEGEALIRSAAALVLGSVSIIRASHLNEALRTDRESDAGEAALLVLVNPTPAEASHARSATDSAGDPRWPVVVLTDNNSSEIRDTLSRAQWTVPNLVRVFESAIACHRSRRAEARTRSDLLSVGRRVVHDLRTPLGAIQTATDALRDELATRLPAACELLQSIEDSAEEMARLMERISLVLKATARPSQKTRLNMGWPFAMACDGLSREISTRGVTVVQPPKWPEVDGVDTWLMTIWSNLLTNALQHGGDVVCVEAGWSESAGGFRFWLCDDGQGVAPEAVGQLFHPFHRLHEPHAPRGVGLALIERLVDLQGGRCGYQPGPDGGACFFFTLPGETSGSAVKRVSTDPDEAAFRGA